MSIYIFNSTEILNLNKSNQRSLPKNECLWYLTKQALDIKSMNVSSSESKYSESIILDRSKMLYIAIQINRRFDENK